MEIATAGLEGTAIFQDNIIVADYNTIATQSQSKMLD